MSRTAETDALSLVLEACSEWGDADRELHAQMRVASDTEGPMPADALAADFAARIRVTRAAINFAEVCPPDGPDTDGLAGAAYVIALHRIATEELASGLKDELSRYEHDGLQWTEELKKWVPGSDTPPAARPSLPSYGRVLDAADMYYAHMQENFDDDLREGLKAWGLANGRDVTETTSIGPDGQLIHTTSLRGLPLEPVGDDEAEELVPEPEPGTVRRWSSIGFVPHIKAGRGRHWLVAKRDRSSAEWGIAVSYHWRGSTAFKAAQQARAEITMREAIDIYELDFLGWRLRDSLPILFPENVAEDGSEVLWGTKNGEEIREHGTYSMTPIALIRPVSGEWMIFVRSVGGPDQFLKPKKLRDTFYRTHAEAAEGARRIRRMWLDEAAENAPE